jgi:hypothetical protein
MAMFATAFARTLSRIICKGTLAHRSTLPRAAKGRSGLTCCRLQGQTTKMLIGAQVDFVFDVGLLKLTLCLEHFATVYACQRRHDSVFLQRSIHRKNIFGYSYIKIPEVQVTCVLVSCDYVLRQSSILKRQPRWMRDQVWGSAKAQDFEAVLIMAAEALRKCEEANAQRAVVAGNAPKKKRAKPEVAVEGSVRVFDLESAMASAPSVQIHSIDD